jgi:hypothetical protein
MQTNGLRPLPHCASAELHASAGHANCHGMELPMLLISNRVWQLIFDIWSQLFSLAAIGLDVKLDLDLCGYCDHLDIDQHALGMSPAG